MKKKEHFDHVARLGCVLAGEWGHECRGRTTVQHIQGAEYRGMGQKAPDWMTFPLCEAHHLFGPNSIEHMGRKPWEKKYGPQRFWLQVGALMMQRTFPDYTLPEELVLFCG